MTPCHDDPPTNTELSGSIYVIGPMVLVRPKKLLLG